MNLFVTDFLSDPDGQPKFDVLGGLDGRSQKVYALLRRRGEYQDGRLANDPITVALFDDWLSDVDGDAHLEPYDYTRDPLVIDGELQGTGDTLRILSLHTKSKYVDRQEALWNDANRRQESVVAALTNRRRISSEAMHTRMYLDDLYDDDAAALVAETGDFNDGPGIDYFERNLLTHGVADILLGTSYRPNRQYEHALVGKVPANQLFAARFDDFVDGIDHRPLLLDHILVSPALHGRYANARLPTPHTTHRKMLTGPKVTEIGCRVTTGQLWSISTNGWRVRGMA